MSHDAAYWDNSDGPSLAWWDEAGDAYEQARLDARLKPMFESFDAYVADWPGGESFRNWLVTTDRPNALILVRGKGTHESLPGGYIWVNLSLSFTITHRNRPAVTRGAMIAVGDCDDGLITREFETDAEAQALFAELKALAPFDFDDLIEAYGFQF